MMQSIKISAPNRSRMERFRSGVNHTVAQGTLFVCLSCLVSRKLWCYASRWLFCYEGSLFDKKEDAQTISQLERMRDMHEKQLSQRTQALSDCEQKMQKMQADYETELEQMLDEQIKAEEKEKTLLAQLEQSRNDCRAERQKSESLKARLEETHAIRQYGESLEAARQTLLQMDALPQTPEAAAEMFLAIHGDKLDFTRRGRSSLKSCQASPALLWNALYCMATTLRELYCLPERKDIVREFQQRTTFELGLNEGSQTHKNNDLMDLRTDTYCGRTIDIEPHVGCGNFRGDKSRSIRLYYTFDVPTRKIVIGFCGCHLPNYSSNKIC